MSIDSNRVKEIFLAAAELPDQTAQYAFLDQACSGDAGLRQRVEELLRSHDPEGSFLATPVVAFAGPDVASQNTIDSAIPANQCRTPLAEDAEELGFLGPPNRPDSLGRLGHYEVLQVLGKGGFGIVLRAFDDILQRVVAIKVMAPQLAATSPARKRFLREARSSAQVRHENVVQVYEVTEQPLPYLVMEFIPGETLQQRLDRKGPLEVQEILRIGRQIAEGLAAAHATDLIHRDIKPGNVLLEGGNQKVKITDFGLARAADDASMTQSGTIAGTPMYMAPEQASGQTLDQRADLFSLGSVLYQMASGRAPFRANTTIAVLKRVAEETPRNIREIIPETPQWLCDIISKLHAKNPNDRYQSAREIADVLANCESQLKEHSKLKDLSLIPQRKATVRLSGSWNWATVAVLLFLLTGASYFTKPLFFSAPVVATIPSSQGPKVVPVAVEDDWVQLFNRRDLSGWRTHPRLPGNWRVENDLLVGSGPGHPSHLFSARGDYENFHLRAEVKVDIAGDKKLHWADSGIYFRSPFALATDSPWAIGYEAQIQAGDKSFGDAALVKTGSLSSHVNYDQPIPGAAAGEWFTLEVIARGSLLTIKINGITTVDEFQDSAFERGHFALQQGSEETIVSFRKIEVKELPPSSPPPTFKNSLGMEFVKVPKGKSWLGGGKDKPGDRVVEIPADFYLGKYEVTQAEWERVMGENPSSCRFEDPHRYPVETVSWEQCQLFVANLNKLEKDKLEKDKGWVYRLPKEVEWEYACRGGPMSDRANSAFDFYLAQPTNRLLPEHANFDKDETTKVGTYQPNSLGIYDMHGNVHEWNLDEILSDRAHKGGTWKYGADNCRAALTGRFPPAGASRHLGLRLARVPSGLASPEARVSPPSFAPLPDVNIERIAALPALEQVEEVRKELKKRNPDFDGKLITTIENEVVTGLEFLANHVSDISPVRALRRLTTLNCRADGLLVGRVSDLRPLQGLPLVKLTLSVNPISDLTPLVGMPLTDLHIDNSPVADLSPLEGMQLKVLNCSYTKVSNLGPLKGAPLSILWCNHTEITDLSPLQGKSLQWITIQATRVSDLTPLKGMPVDQIYLDYDGKRDREVLRSLTALVKINDKSTADFWREVDEADAWRTRVNALPGEQQAEEVKQEIKRRNPEFSAEFKHRIEDGKFTELMMQAPGIRDLSPVRGLVDLRFLECSSPTLEDISPLRGLPLRDLSIRGSGVSDLTPLKGMTIASLECSACPNLTDLTPLAGLPLQGLQIAYTRIKDLSPLKGMKLVDLNCEATEVADLAPLTGMPLTHVRCRNTQVTDLTPLQGMPLQVVTCEFKPERDTAILRAIKTLERINDLPAAEFWKKIDNRLNQ